MDAVEFARELESSFEIGLASDELSDLVEFLLAQGATGDEIRNAAANGSLGGLALDLALRPGGETLDFGTAAGEAGLTLAEGERIWAALGFPDPIRNARRLDPAGVETLRFVATVGRDLLGPEHSLALARAIGAGTARLAEAVVDAFRVRMEVPQLAAGVRYPEVVEQFVAVAREHVPRFTAAMSVVLRHHLVEVASGAWSFDRETGASRRELCIGFVDLVGYTALTHTSTTRTMLDTIIRFEDLIGEVLNRGGGRLVKLIGDGAMFVVDEPEQACRLVLDLVETFESDRSVPPVRVALAYGTVVATNGDYYGDVVNIAARLVAAADPGTAVATAELVDAASVSASAEQLPARALKGFPEPVTAFRLIRC